MVFLAPRVGLEPTTLRLTAECSTIELSRIISFSCFFYVPSKPHTEIHLTSLLFYPEPSGSSNSLSFLRSSFRSSLRPISDSQLQTLPCFHLCPIYLVVFKGSYRFCGGYLILRGASRLDAFSVYPFPTWLPGHATGVTTGAPEVSPTRSSRTKVSSSQISYACDR